MLVDLENLVGVEGVTTTSLNPGGKARFANALVDVMSVGEFIPRQHGGRRHRGSRQSGGGKAGGGVSGRTKKLGVRS